MNHLERDVDVVVIGLGPGGEHAAGTLAEAGLAVAGVESRLVGGECPYWGCVPSKMMIRAADLVAEGRRIPGMAGRSGIAPDWAPVARRIRAEATGNWDDKVAADRFTGKGGILVRGHGRITAPGEVTVTPVAGRHDGAAQVLRARRGIVLAAGTTAAVPPIPGLAGTPFWTNHEAIETEQVPESLVVLGGGAIGSELAQVFARFGSRVTVAEGAGRLLPLEEPESGDLLAAVFGREGITVRTGRPAARVAHSAGRGFTVTLDGGEDLTGSALLVATGRRTGLARARRRRGRHRRDAEGHPGGRAPAGRPRRVGAGRHHRQGRVHAHVHVPGGHRHRRHPGTGAPRRRVPRRAPGHVHRPGDRRGGADREAGAGQRAGRCARA